MYTFERHEIEKILKGLSRTGEFFPGYMFTMADDGMVLLGEGGAAFVYEMYSESMPDVRYALKVTGFKEQKQTSKGFWSTRRIMSAMSNSPYILRIIDGAEFAVTTDEDLNITDVQKFDKERKEDWEVEDRQELILQCILTEELEPVLVSDDFGKVKINIRKLFTEEGVISFAYNIGQALLNAHIGKVLHRDVKLENIFYDSRSDTFKLGDFDIAKRMENLNTETVAYTNGYVAPEIENHESNGFSETSDIYSFGVTLYLLLNDLRFPDSNGYHVNKKLQYCADYSFPPIVGLKNPALMHLIQKMCHYNAAYRYQNMAEVLKELAKVGKERNVEKTDDVYDLATEATAELDLINGRNQEIRNGKTVSMTDGEATGDIIEAGGAKNILPGKKKGPKSGSREEAIIRDRKDIKSYRLASGWHTAVLSALFILLFEGIETEADMPGHLTFLMFSAGLLAIGLFQKIRDLNFIFSISLLIITVLSITGSGLSFIHVLVITCVLAGEPEFSLAAGIGSGLWDVLHIFGRLGKLQFISGKGLGFVVLILLFLELGRLFSKKIRYRIVSYDSYSWYYVLFFLMALCGLVFFILSKCNVMVLPEFVKRMRLIPTGLITCVIQLFFGPDESDLEATVEDKQVSED